MATTWRDRLHRVNFGGPGGAAAPGKFLIGATFRGVPFHVSEGELAGGRRTVAHEYPLRDRPFVEDLGRLQRLIQIDGYVLGDDYLARRDALIEALEQEGPGELLHPYYGTLRVAASRFRVRESSDAGGMARFAIDFEETDADPPAPVLIVAAEAQVAATADAADAAEAAAFEVAYQVDGLPASALTGLSAVVASAAVALDLALSPVIQGAQELASLKRQLDELVADASGLVRQPAALLARLQATLESLVAMPLSPRLGLRALLDAAAFTPSEARPAGDTSTRLAAAAAYDALFRLVRILLATQAARLAAGETWETYDQAVEFRDELAASIEALSETASDDAYAGLQQLRADLVRAVPGQGSDLPRLVSYTPPATVPSLVLAHQLYGDLLLEADLVTRNRVARPGFIPGSIPLQVLTRA